MACAACCVAAASEDKYLSGYLGTFEPNGSFYGGAGSTIDSPKYDYSGSGGAGIGHKIFDNVFLDLGVSIYRIQTGALNIGNSRLVVNNVIIPIEVSIVGHTPIKTPNDFFKRMTLFGGFGVGYYTHNMEMNFDGASRSYNSHGAGYQGKAGIEYEFPMLISVNAAVKFFRARTKLDYDSSDVSMDIAGNSMAIGMKYRF